MAHELRILATVPLGDDQLANASVMHKLSPAVEVFKKAALNVVGETDISVKLVKVRDTKLQAPAAAELAPEPPAELPLESAPTPAKADNPKGGGAPWLKKQQEGEAA